MLRPRRSLSLVRRLFRQIDGQDLIEYGVLIALVAAGVIASATAIGVKVPGFYTTTAAALPGDDPGNGDPGNGNPGNGNPGNGNPGNGNPGNGNPGNGNPGNGNPGGNNPGGGNPGGGNPGGGNPGGGNPGGGKGK